MNAPLRRVGLVLILLFGLLFVNLNLVQGYRADEYRNSDYNGRVQVAEYENPRGKLFLADGTQLAVSVATTDELKYLRTYPAAGKYAHAIGYKPVNGAATAIERLENDFLAGTAPELVISERRIRDLFTGRETPGGDVQLTLLGAVQDAAVSELANNRVRATKGAIVALDPRTGGVLAMASMPSFDPNPLTSHDTVAAEAAYNVLEKDPTKPLQNRAVQETFPPGSTFKVIAAATALQKGLTQETVLTGGATYQSPDTTSVINNAPGVQCPQQITLRQALTVSCNTAFSRLCVEQLGVGAVQDMARNLGFESPPTLEGDRNNVFRVASSTTDNIKDPDGSDNFPKLAQSCIGQADVRQTPLQAALVAAAVANGGDQMRPYLVEKRQGPDLTTLYVAEPRRLRQAMSGQVAGNLQQMMINVVDNGTGRNARIPGFRVGGKTGTAEAGESASDHGWFIGFVMKDNEPIAAVAVLLESAGRGGSGEAARIAGLVMRAVLKARGLQ